MISFQKNEFAPFYKNYVDLAIMRDDDPLGLMGSSMEEFTDFLKGQPEEKLIYRYAEGKWTIKDIVQHLIDAERIFAYRALRFSRNDPNDLPGFDENAYVEEAHANQRNLEGLLKEFEMVRRSTIELFQSFSAEDLLKNGTASGNQMSVRALGFIISGHLIHHFNIIRERYL